MSRLHHMRRPVPLVRRRSLLQRTLAYPADLLLSLVESYETLPWDRLVVFLSWPLGLAFNVLAYLAATSAPDSCDIKTMLTPSSYLAKGRLFKEALKCWTSRSAVVTIALGLLSVLNAVALFRKSRQYRFYHVDPLNLPKSKNIKYVLSRPPSLWKRFKRGVYASLPWRRDDDSDKDSVDSESEPANLSEEVAQLSIWEISRFYRNIFCLFSPIQWILFSISRDEQAKPILVVFIPLMLFSLINAFTEYISDKELVFQHVMYEYNKSMVNPLVQAMKAEEDSKNSKNDSPVFGASEPSHGANRRRSSHSRYDDEDDSNVRWANTRHSSPRAAAGSVLRPCDDCKSRHSNLRHNDSYRASVSENGYADRDQNIFQGLNRRRFSKD